MKPVKLFCGVALVVSVALVYAVPSVASADTICRANETPCSKANSLPEKANYVRSEAWKFCLTGCSEGSLVWKESTTKDNGPDAGLAGAIEVATFSGVKGECKEASALNLPWASEWTASNQRLSYTGGGSGSPGISLKGCFGVNATCQYSSASGLWSVVGGNPLKLHELGTLWGKSGGSALCPESGEWFSEGQMTEPTGLLHLVALP
jgi:hypothetical protein